MSTEHAPSAARVDGMVIGPIACMCVTCKRPFYSALRSREEMVADNPDGRFHCCETCGDVIRNLVFECDCTDDPVFAVPPAGRCQHCDAELSRSLCDESVPKLRELLAR